MNEMEELKRTCDKLMQLLTGDQTGLFIINSPSREPSGKDDGTAMMHSAVIIRAEHDREKMTPETLRGLASSISHAMNQDKCVRAVILEAVAQFIENGIADNENNDDGDGDDNSTSVNFGIIPNKIKS